MESLALTVALMLFASILLAGTALLFAWLYRQGRASYRSAIIWIVLAAIDVGFISSSGQPRAYVMQAAMLGVAIFVVDQARRSRELQ
jgi:hypothetical protein